MMEHQQQEQEEYGFLGVMILLCVNVRIEVCVVFWPQSPGPVSLRIPNHPHLPPSKTHTQICLIYFDIF